MHPVLFHWGPVTLYSYGFFVALALFLSFWVAGQRAARHGLERTVVSDLVCFLFLSGLAGARLLYVLQHAQDYRSDPWRVLNIQEGGLVWYGGFIVAAAAGILYARARRWPLIDLCDFFAPVTALAQAVGRLGCFFNGCCYGKIAASGLGVVFPGQDEPRLPVQLYEFAALCLISALLLWRSLAKRRRGEIFVLYLLLTSATRFFLEFFRGDQTPVVFLTLPQWTSIVLFAGACVLYAAILKQKTNHEKF